MKCNRMFRHNVILAFTALVSINAIANGNDIEVTTRPLDLSSPPTIKSLMQAGQLGGTLFPTSSVFEHGFEENDSEISKRALRDSDIQVQNEQNLSFGRAIQAWNAHDYKNSFELFKQHVEEYPHSPWVAESLLHMGCEARFQGRYTEAAKHYSEIITKNEHKTTYGAKKLTNKARLRSAVLSTLEYDFDSALGYFSELYKNALDWRDRTYASHWIQRLSRYKSQQIALVDCGTKALAAVIENKGDKNTAEQIRSLDVKKVTGHSLNELISIAERQGYELIGRKLSIKDINKAPLPFIAQINRSKEGEKGHYWIVEQILDKKVLIQDPQSKRRFTQSFDEFKREWLGAALLFVDKDLPKNKIPGNELAKIELDTLTGACCGIAREESNLGVETTKNAIDFLLQESNGTNSEFLSCGEPKWLINQVSMNFYMQDIPLWYSPGIGPSINIKLSYNSQSANAYHEPFGNKWQFNYASYLVLDPGNTITIFMPDGHRDIYNLSSVDSDGNYNSTYNPNYKLREISENFYELIFPEGGKYIYSIPNNTNSMQTFLTAIEDKYGKQVLFSYNADVQLSSIIDAENKMTRLQYNDKNLVSSVTDPFGRTASFSYDDKKNLIQIVDMGGITTDFSYDEDVYISSVDYGQGKWDIFIEPALEIPAGETEVPDPEPDNDDINQLYVAPGENMWNNYRITITSPEGLKEEYFFDGFHGEGWYVAPDHYIEYEDSVTNNYTKATKTIYEFTESSTYSGIKRKKSGCKPNDPYRFNGYKYIHCKSVETKYGYNSRGKRTSVRVGSSPNDISFTYTGNNLSQIQVPKSSSYYGPKTTLNYADNNEDIIKISNGLINISLDYNITRDISKITNSLGEETTYTYNQNDQISSAIDALNIRTDYIYNSQNRLTAIQRDGQTIVSYSYDLIGRVESTTNDSGLTLFFEYDDLNRIKKIIYPDGKSIDYNWSSVRANVLDKMVSRGGQETTYEYDAQQRLKIEVKAGNEIVQFQYDLNGNLKLFIDVNQNKTTFNYDAQNRLIERIYADGSMEAYSYETSGKGRLLSKTNARGIKTTYSYDYASNLTRINYSDNTTPNVSYKYDNYNRLVERRDGLGTFYYSYDDKSNLIKIDGPWVNDAIEYEYDALNRRIGLSVANGNQTQYFYDAHGRKSQIISDNNVYRFDYASPVSPLIATVTYPSGAQTQYQRDSLLRVNTITHSTSSGSTINQFDYTYNNQDLIATETVAKTHSASSFVNDEINYAYNVLNQLTASTQDSTTYQYDKDGNLVKGKTTKGMPFEANYDAENRLVQLLYSENGIAYETIYSYGSDNLVGKIDKYIDGALNSTVHFVRDGFLPLQERDSDNQLIRHYIWRTSSGGGVGQLLGLEQNGQHYHYLFDAKGNVINLIDNNQQVVASYGYDTFGSLATETSSINQPIRFSTKYYDSSTGFIDYGYRFYDSSNGRWLNRDPIRENGGVNLYAFVNNNPVNYFDPSGHLAQFLLMGAGVAIFGYGFHEVFFGAADNIENHAKGIADSANANNVEQLKHHTICYGYALNKTAYSSTGISTSVQDHYEGKIKGSFYKSDLNDELKAQCHF